MSETDASQNCPPPPPLLVREDLLPDHLANSRLSFVLHNVLSPDECAGVIRSAEAVGFKRATVRTGFKTFEYQADHRVGENCYLTEPDIRDTLLSRIRRHLPEEFRFGRLVGLNERMTVLRYGPGGFFGEHTDGTVITTDDSAISFITIQLYLNDDFEGGETTFFPDGPARPGTAAEQRRRVAVTPRTGSAAVFEHKILHEGSRVLSGTKLTLRADVLYTRYYPPADEAAATLSATSSRNGSDDAAGVGAEELPWQDSNSLWSRCVLQ